MAESIQSGISAAAKFNPHLWSAAELRAIFVARSRELAQIVSAIEASDAAHAPQHILVTGQRGMGKSTLLQRVALAVEDDASLSEKWLALRFPEEQYTVSTPAELWSNVIGALADAQERKNLPTQELDAKLASLESLAAPARESACLAYLEKWCSQHKKRLLLLIDSTDLLFSNLANAETGKAKKGENGGANALWRVRKTLQHAPHFFWLGVSYQPLETAANYSDAFLDFFQLIELRALRLEEMRAAILAMAKTFGAGRGLIGEKAQNAVKQLLDARPERLQVLRLLSGGNPRTTVMLYELFAAGGKDSVKADLERLLDTMTPLYKARLELLADQPRKVLAHVMEHWAPISVKQLTQSAGIAVGSISAQLSRLEQEGLIEKCALSGTKRSGYQCAERFFNIWYLMRNAARGARARVAWLVEFMRLWFSQDELHGLAKLRMLRHKSGAFCDLDELEHSRAIALALDHEGDRRSLEWMVYKQARSSKDFGLLFDLSEYDKQYAGPEDYLKRFAALDAKLRLADLPDDEKDRWVFEVKRSLDLPLREKERFAEQSASLTSAEIEIERAQLNRQRADTLEWFDERNVAEVEQAVIKGDFFPDCPEPVHALTQIEACFSDDVKTMFVAAWLLRWDASDTRVAKFFQGLTTAHPHSEMTWILYALNHLQHSINIKPSETALRNAISINPHSQHAWRHLAKILVHIPKRKKVAQNAISRAIEISPDSPKVWLLQASYFEKNKQLDCAEAAFTKAISLAPDRHLSWQQLAHFCSRNSRSKDAISAIQRALEIYPRDCVALTDLGKWLGVEGQLKAAEITLNSAIEIDSSNLWAWTALGVFLAALPNRENEAEAAFKQVLFLDPALYWVREPLATLILRAPSRSAEASKIYLDGLTLNPQNLWERRRYAAMLHDELRNIWESAKQYRIAQNMWRSNESFTANFARNLAELGQEDEATKLYREALRLDGGKTDNISLQANLWLGNRDYALQALQALQAMAKAAALPESASNAYFELTEQCYECHEIGRGLALAALMQETEYRAFLQPFALALLAANGKSDALLDAPAEVQAIAQEVLKKINEREAKKRQAEAENLLVNLD